MSAPNPYQAPQAAVTEAEGATQPVRLFAVSGRIGRLRYIAYGVLIYAGLLVVSGLLSAALAPLGTAGAIVGAFLPWVLIIILSFALTIQRCHDFNTTGWLSLLGLVPLVNLIFWFIPGTDGPNRYGPPTPPNTVLVYIGAVATPVVMVALVGILAAVAIPAQQDYASRARVSEVIMVGSEWRTMVHEYYVSNGKFPASAADLNSASANVSKFGKASLAQNGVIELTLSAEAGRSVADKTILIQPKVAGANLEWDCTGGTLHAKFRPARCRAQ